MDAPEPADSVGERVFGQIRVRVAHEDLARIRADVLVNAANNQLHMGGGVAGALRSRGGIEIHQEAIQHAPAPIGSVVKTGAGKLDARFVYHAVVIDYDVSKGTAEGDVSAAMRNILRQAETDQVLTMALPLFGAGVGGLSVEASLQSILAELEKAGPKFREELSVVIAVRDSEEFEQARAVFAAYQNAEARRRDDERAASDFLEQYLKNRA